jgi:hypothetical protein
MPSRATIRKHDADLEAVDVFAVFQRLERLGEMAAGIEREDVDLRCCLRDAVQHGLILNAEAG